MSPVDWSLALLWRRIEDATEQCTETYAGAQRMACAGRELLAELVPAALSLRDYPAVASDDWRELADAAYEAARSSWLDGGSDDDMHACAGAAAGEVARTSRAARHLNGGDGGARWARLADARDRVARELAELTGGAP